MTPLPLKKKKETKNSLKLAHKQNTHNKCNLAKCYTWRWPWGWGWLRREVSLKDTWLQINWDRFFPSKSLAWSASDVSNRHFMFDFYSTHVSESNQWFLWKRAAGTRWRKMLLISILSAQNCHPQLIDVSGVYLRENWTRNN